MEHKDLKCQDCGEVKEDVKETTCPFAKDVYGEEVSCILCDDCGYERAMDI